MAVFAVVQQGWMVSADTPWPTKPKIFIWLLMENVYSHAWCQQLLSVLSRSQDDGIPGPVLGTRR